MWMCRNEAFGRHTPLRPLLGRNKGSCLGNKHLLAGHKPLTRDGAILWPVLTRYTMPWTHTMMS